MKKRVLSWFLVLLLLVSTLPQSVFANVEEPMTVSVGIYDYTALTYDDALSTDGIVATEASFPIEEGTKALEVFLDFFEAKGLTYALNEQYNYIESIGGLGEFTCGSESGWMFSVNDNFGNMGAAATTVEPGDRLELHYSVSGYGADVGSYFGNLPTVQSFTLAGKEVNLSTHTTYGGAPDYITTTEYYLGEYVEDGENVLLEGNGSEATPFVIPVTVPYNTDLTAQSATMKTSLHPQYRVFGDVDPTEENDYTDGLTFSIETVGGFHKTYYTVQAEIAPPAVTIGIYDHTALTYDDALSTDGIVATEASFPIEEGTKALEVFLDFFEAKGLTYALNEQYNYIESIGGLGEFTCGSESGWMFSVNDNFGNMGAAATTVEPGDRLELHYSVSGYGADVGSYFGNLPTVQSFTLAGKEVTLSTHTTYGGAPDYITTTEYYLGEYVEDGENVLLEGNGSEATPFVIPITVPYNTDLTAQSAAVKTSLHPQYRVFGDVDPTEKNNYTNGLAFSLKTKGDFHETHYIVRVNKASAPSSGGGSYVEKPLPIADVSQSLADIAATLMATEPVVGSIGGEWMVFGLARSGAAVEEEYFRSYFDALFAKLNEKEGVLHERKYTEYARAVLALSAVGRNPTRFSGYDLAAPLLDVEAVERQGLNGVVWALLALDSCDASWFADVQTVETTKELYKTYILDNQVPGGGWALSGQDASVAEADMTAMALTALASYGETTVVNKGIRVLAKLPAESAETLSWIVVAMAENGVALNDTRFDVSKKTPLDRLLDYRTETGFAHTLGGETDAMATEQGFYALVAAERAQKEQATLFDFSDRRSISRVASKPIVHESVSFSDLDDCDVRDKILALAQRNVLQGRGDGRFCPEDTLTRAELATLTVNALSLTRREETSFADLAENAWYQSYVEIAVAHKIILGMTLTIFEPDGLVTREHTALMLNRAAAILELDALFPTETDATPMTRAEAAAWLYDLLNKAAVL